MKTSVFCAAMMKPINDIFGSQIKIMIITRHIKPSLISFSKLRKNAVIGKGGLEDTKNFWHTSISLPYTEKYNLIQKSIDPNSITMAELTGQAFSKGIENHSPNSRQKI